MRPSIARAIVFNSFDLAIAGRIAADKSRDPFLCWVYLNKKLTIRRNGRSVMMKCLQNAQEICQVRKMTVQRHVDPNRISFWAYDTSGSDAFICSLPIHFHQESGQVVHRLQEIELEDLTDLQCVRIAYALTFIYVHETKSPFDGQAANVREMFGMQSIL